jgi:hypothetical protein
MSSESQVVRALNANFGCCGVLPDSRWSIAEQVSLINEQRPDIIMAQETVSLYHDDLIESFGHYAATHLMRRFADMRFRTGECLAIFSPRWPIVEQRGIALGNFQFDGIEPVDYLRAVEETPLQASALAARIETPHGDMWAVTAHMAWTRMAHEGLKPHQATALQNLAIFLGDLRPGGLPIVLGADFNTPLPNCDRLLPWWMNRLVTDEMIDVEGTSIDTPPGKEALRTKLVQNGVFIDGICAVDMTPVAVRCLSGISDHKGIVADMAFSPASFLAA